MGRKLCCLAILTVADLCALWAGVAGAASVAQSPAPAPPVPTRVVANSAASSDVQVTWSESAAGGPVSGFQVREVQPTGAVGPVVASTGPSTSSVLVAGLENCRGYGFEVQAVGPGGGSGWSARSRIAVPHWTPSGQPPLAVILMEGVDSVSSPDVYYAEAASSRAHPSESSYCYAGDGFTKALFPSTLQALVDNFNPTLNVGPANSMTDALAAHPGVVLLPWSFKGVWLDAHAAGGTLVHVRRSVRTDANNTPILTDAATLDAEVRSVHQAWPHTRIVILGHSLGGLIAEQYWEHYWRDNPEGVSRIIALDAPINGVADATLRRPQQANVFSFFEDLWASMDWHDPAISANDSDGAFLPVGTEGDDGYASQNAGMDTLLSQLLFRCTGFVSQTCTPLSPAFVSPCPSPDHAEVKACPGVINYVQAAAFTTLGASGDGEIARPADPVRSPHPPNLSFAALLAHLYVPLVRIIAGAPWARLTAPVAMRGQLLRLQGAGLGPLQGLIRMARRGGGTTAATIVRWTPGGVLARVPADAESGEISLTASTGAIVSVPGIAVLAPSGKARPLTISAHVTAALGTQLDATVQVRDGRRAAAHRTIFIFDGVRQRTQITDRAGTAHFVFSANLASQIVVVAGTAWRTIRVQWTQPPVTAVRLHVVPRHPRAGRRFQVVASLRGPDGRASHALVTFMLTTATGSTGPKTIRTTAAGAATVSFTAAAGGATITATSNGTTAAVNL